MRPRRRADWLEDDGKVALLRPRLGHGWLGRRLEALFQPPPHRVHLDDVGSFVWKRIDGAARVEEIAVEMRERFGESVEPVEDRLVAFLRSLERAKLVDIIP